MTVSDKDLFLAILAMDSYNRGYDAGIKNAGDDDPDGLGEFGSRIGNASVMAVSLPEGAQAAGSYAVAYETQYGTVISYRGADFTPAVDFASDRDQGWTLGGSTFFAEQAKRGVDFLAAVQPENALDRPLLLAHH